jgi:flagellar biosynthetic protein FlhB
MADERDDSQRTEQPTQKRLQDAEERGDVVQSPDISAWLVLATATAFIALAGSQTASSLGRMMTGFLAQPHALALNAKTAGGLMEGLGAQLLMILAAPLGLLLAVGVGAHWLQHKPVLSWEKLKPDVARLNPLKGFSRLFGRAALVSFAKGLLKTAAAAVAIGAVLWPARNELLALITMPVVALLPWVQGLTTQILIAALAVLGVIALADYGFQYFERLRRLRMTRQEIRDEFKQTEGDPAVKARLKQLRAERARRRMMAAVPKAAVIITNPTHYSVALAYEQGKTAAPVCVAKGVDSLALRIREVGQAHDVPIVENVALARTLYASVDVDETIKPEHYKAVAQVIGFVMRAKNKAAARRPVR